MSTAHARRNSRIFAATIVPDSVEPLTTTKGVPYTRMKGATILRGDKPHQIRTVLAFGKPNETVRHLLTPGEPVALAVQYDGGTLKVIGLPRNRNNSVDKTAASEQSSEEAPSPGQPYVERAISEISGILWLFEIDEAAQESIINEMLTGDTERPADGPDELETSEPYAQVIEHFGHIMNPLLNAGIDMTVAARITDLILDIPAGDYLNDMRRFREQQAVHGLLDQAP